MLSLADPAIDGGPQVENNLSATFVSPLDTFGLPDRRPMIVRSMDRATKLLVPSEASKAEKDRIDPLERLFDPAFTDKFWEYEHAKIPGGLVPGKLHAAQIERLNSESLHRWLFWGNQVGKTTLGAVDMVLSALGRHPHQLSGKRRMPPFTGWASALSWELWEKVLLPELLTWIPVWRILDAPPPHAHSTKRDIVILADNGRESRITGKAAEQGPDKYQSARVDKVWLDEEHPEAVWDEIQPRLLRFGGTTLGTMTPLKGQTTFIFARIYEDIRTARVGPERHSYTHAGLRDNPGITPEQRAEMLAELAHNPTQLAARDEGKFVRPMGAVLPWDPEKHQTEKPFGLDDIEKDAKLAALWQRGAWYGALDLGKWRFAFIFGVADSDAQFTLVDEYFSQNQDATTRAKGMDTLLKGWRVPDSIMIPADCADPKGIEELNEAFEAIGSPYRVYAIAGNLKSKQTGISRVENLMNRGAWKVRRSMGAGMTWFLGMSAAKPGKPIIGSRCLWEAAMWVYPTMPDGKIQKDEPDDASADGADMMDAWRYLAVSFFPADAPKPPKKNLTTAQRLKKELEDLDRHEEESDNSTRHKYGGVLRQ